MADPLEALEQDIYQTQSPTWTAAKIRQQIIQTAQAQRVDPALALAVAHQESRFDPGAVGDEGAGLGLFQLHAGAAQDAGIPVQARGEPGWNIEGGVRYLRQKLDQAGGDVVQALQRYNGGGDPQYVAHVGRWYPLHAATLGREAPPSTPGLWQRASRFLVGTAEAAAPLADIEALERSIYGSPAPPAAGTPAPTAPPNDRDALEHQIYGSASQPPPAPAPPEDIRSLPRVVPNPDPSQPATLEYPTQIPIEKGQGGAAPPDALPAAAGQRPVIEITKGQAAAGPEPDVPALSPESRAVLATMTHLQPFPSSAPITPPGVEPTPTVRLPEDVALEARTPWQKTADVGKMAVATGINMVGTYAGAVAGAATGPYAPVAVPLMMMAGSELAHEINKALGLEEQGLLGDAIAVLGPLAPYLAHLPPILRQAVARSRAGQAVLEALGKQRAATQEAGGGSVRLGQTTPRADATPMPWPGEGVPVAAQKAAEVQAAKQTLARQRPGLEGALAVEEALTERASPLVTQRQLDQQRYAMDQAALATHEAQAAQATQQAEAYQTALAKAQHLQAEYRAGRATYQQAVEAQRQAGETAATVPRRYLPKVPGGAARAEADIMRDFEALDQGGPAAEAVVRRLGVRSVEEARFQLIDEPVGVPPAEGAAIPSPYRVEASSDPYKTPQGQWKVPLEKIPSHQLELRDFIRQQKGIRLEGEELHGELAALVSRKQAGIGALQNNSTGKTLQQIAEAAQEHGFVSTADKEAFLDKLRQSLSEGKPVYSMYRTLPEEALASQSARLQRQSGPGAPVSRLLYDQLAEVAGQAPVMLQPVKEVASVLQSQLGASMPAMQPSRLQQILSDLVGMRDQGSVAQVQQALKDLGPLTRVQDGQTRGIAKQLVGALQQAMTATAMEMPETATARTLLLQANAAYRKELAVVELERLVQAGRGYQGGRPTFNADTVLRRFDQALAREPLFAGSFTPSEIAAIRQDFQALAGTPKIPTRPPAQPGPVMVREAPVPEVVIPGQPAAARGYRELPEPVELRAPAKIDYPAPTPPAAVPTPALGAPGFGQTVRGLVQNFLGLGGLGMTVLGVGGMPGKVALGVGALLKAHDLSSEALAQLLMMPRWRPYVLRSLASGEPIPAAAMAQMQGALTAAGQRPPRERPGPGSARNAR